MARWRKNTPKLGKEVLRVPMRDQAIVEFNVRALAGGRYTLRIQDRTGKTMLTKPLVKLP